MNTLEAIDARHSVRQYLDKPIEAEKLEKLKVAIEECNKQKKLHIQLVTDEPNAFGTGMAKYGKFSGINNYIALIGRKGEDEAIGYCGEHLVLMAQCMGLNSCWVGLTFSRQPDKYVIAKGEKLYLVIALGYGATQGVPHPQKKGIDAYYRNETKSKEIPEWFKQGMEAALKAPTAVNQQRFEFALQEDNTVVPYVRFTVVGYGKIDLGIAKYHFEVGAGLENFKWAK